MARPGKFDHLKAKILAKFQEGLSAAQVAKLYSQIPRATIYTWFDEFRQNFDRIPTNTTIQVQSGLSRNPPRLQIVPFHDLEGTSSEEYDSECVGESDVENSRKIILWVRRKLIKEMRVANGAVVAQLANAVLRSAEVLQKLSEQSEESPRVESLTPAQVAERIGALLDRGRRRMELAKAQAQINDDERGPTQDPEPE